MFFSFSLYSFDRQPFLHSYCLESKLHQRICWWWPNDWLRWEEKKEMMMPYEEEEGISEEILNYWIRIDRTYLGDNNGTGYIYIESREDRLSIGRSIEIVSEGWRSYGGMSSIGIRLTSWQLPNCWWGDSDHFDPRWKIPEMGIHHTIMNNQVFVEFSLLSQQQRWNHHSVHPFWLHEDENHWLIWVPKGDRD